MKALIRTTDKKEKLVETTEPEYLDYNNGLYEITQKGVRSLIKDGKITNERIIRFLETNPIPVGGSPYKIPSVAEMENESSPLGRTIVGRAIIKSVVRNVNQTSSSGKFKIPFKTIGKMIPIGLLALAIIAIIIDAIS